MIDTTYLLLCFMAAHEMRSRISSGELANQEKVRISVNKMVKKTTNTLNIKLSFYREFERKRS